MSPLEPVLSFLDNQTSLLTGFIMAGVLLILIGVQNVTRKDLKEYFRHKKDLHKIDRIIAWGIFYIIFGSLILISSVLTVSIYL